jgi:DNA-binding NarL/FixJ family response regulator
MRGIVVSESSIVAKAIDQTLQGWLDGVRRFARLADIAPALKGDASLLVYDVGRPAEDVEALLQFMETPPPSCRVIVLTKATHSLRDFEPLVGRVNAILPFSAELEEIALVARLVCSDLFLLPSTMLPFLQAPRVRLPSNAPTARLTEREMSVLELIAEGASNKVIARKLGNNDTTVRVHVRSVLRKLGVNNRTQAALLVTQNATVPANVAA